MTIAVNVPGLAARLAELAPNESTTLVLVDDPRMTDDPDEGALRMHAFRLGSGVWHLRLEEYRAFWTDFPSFREWQTLTRAWDAQGYPVALCAIEASDEDEIPGALGLLLAWAGELDTDAPQVELAEKVAA